MNTSLTEDAIDGLLGDFFKAQMRKPWPAAPAAPSVTSEPSVLVAARASHATEPPRNQPTAAQRDPGGKARYTLAASVALLLGTCWTLSNGFQPGEPTAPGSNSSPVGPVNMNSLGASDPAALKEIRKDNAVKGNNGGFTPPKIELP